MVCEGMAVHPGKWGEASRPEVSRRPEVKGGTPEIGEREECRGGMCMRGRGWHPGRRGK